MMMGEVLRNGVMSGKDGKHVYTHYYSGVRYRLVIGNGRKNKTVISYYTNSGKAKDARSHNAPNDDFFKSPGKSPHTSSNDSIPGINSMLFPAAKQIVDFLVVVPKKRPRSHDRKHRFVTRNVVVLEPKPDDTGIPLFGALFRQIFFN